MVHQQWFQTGKEAGEAGAASFAFDSDASTIPRMHVPFPPVLIFPSIIEALEGDGAGECGATSAAVVTRLGELRKYGHLNGLAKATIEIAIQNGEAAELEAMFMAWVNRPRRDLESRQQAVPASPHQQQAIPTSPRQASAGTSETVRDPTPPRKGVASARGPTWKDSNVRAFKRAAPKCSFCGLGHTIKGCGTAPACDVCNAKGKCSKRCTK